MSAWSVSMADLPSPAVPLADLKAHLRVDLDTEDALIDAIGSAATEAVERASGRLLVQRQAVLATDWPVGGRDVALPYPPVASVSALWRLSDGTTEQAGSVEVLALEEGIVRLPDGQPAGTVRDALALEVTYTAGYASAPGPLLAAVKLLAGYLYDRREGVPLSRIGDGLVGGLPPAVHALIAPFRFWYGGPSWKRAA